MKTKKIIAVGAALALSATLAACGGGEEGSSSDEPVTLTFAAVTFTETGRGEALTEFVGEFNDSQERITIEPVGIPFATFAQTVLTQTAGGEGPDLIRWDQADFVQAASEGLLLELDELIDFSQYNLIPAADEYTHIDGKRYGFIFDVASYALIYNTELVPEPPKTWDEFVAMTKELTQGETYGMAFRQTKEQEPGMMQDLFNYVYGFGGAFSDGENLTLNAPEVVEGLEAYESLYDAEVIPRGADAATYRRMMAEGLVAMTIDNGGVPAILRGANPDIQLGAAPAPLPAGSQGGIFVPLTINKNTEDPEAAAEFMKWLLEDENQVKLQEIMGGSAVATETERSAEALEDAPYLEVFDSLIPTTQPQVIAGFESQTPQLRTIIVDAVLSALHDEATMAEAMDNAQEQGLDLVG